MKAHIKFSHNHNLKLNCAAFTTFRIEEDPNDYQPGKVIDVYMKAKNGTHTFPDDKNKYVCIGAAEIVSKQLVKHREITDAMAVIDCGHKRSYLQTLLSRIYAKRFANTGVETVYVRLCLMYVRTNTIPVEAFLEDNSYYIVKPPHIKSSAA